MTKPAFEDDLSSGFDAEDDFMNAPLKPWDSAAGAALETPESHTGWVHAVAFSPAGKQLASASSDWTARSWSGSSLAACS